MSIIENFAALSEKEQRDFAEALVKTINSENTFPYHIKYVVPSNFKFNISEVYPDELTGDLVIEIEPSTPIWIPRDATWQCGIDDDPEDVVEDAEFINDIHDDIKQVFKTLTADIDGYRVTLDVSDWNYPPRDFSLRNRDLVFAGDVTKEDSGIGHYEYWGDVGYDSRPYVEADGVIVTALLCYLNLTVEPLLAAMHEELEDEYYEDGSELFASDYSNITGVIEDIIEDIDQYSAPDDEAAKAKKEKLTSVLNDPEQLEALKDLAVAKVCDNEIIINYISDYTIRELSDIDGIWNEFGDCLESAIYEFINK